MMVYGLGLIYCLLEFVWFRAYTWFSGNRMVWGLVPRRFTKDFAGVHACLCVKSAHIVIGIRTYCLLEFVTNVKFIHTYCLSEFVRCVIFMHVCVMIYKIR
jgi:hypothetical protein